MMLLLLVLAIALYVGMVLFDFAAMLTVYTPVVGVHILEERKFDFRGFQSTWFETGTKRIPTGALKALLVDQLGLFLALTFCFVSGSDLLMSVAVGVIAVDILHHVVLTAAARRYTPGIVTCALYAWFLPFMWADISQPSIVGLAVGGGVIVGNYLLARRKAAKFRSWRGLKLTLDR